MIGNGIVGLGYTYPVSIFGGGGGGRYPRFMQHAGVEDKHAAGISPPSGIL
jgi:hypothetical protein